MRRRDFLKASALLAAPRPWEQDAKPAPFQEITPEQTRAVDRGLEWLAQRGQFNSGAVGATSQVAFTGIAGLAFMANNSTPFRGKYAANVRGCLRFILRNCARSGYINEAAGRGLGGSGMHGHGYATWFLAELYGMCGDAMDLGDDSVKEKLQLAIKVIEDSQDPMGGWTYEPRPYGSEGSVTITQVQALRSARNSGLAVRKGVIEKGIDYIRKSSNPDGTIAYSLSSRHSGGTYALTAAGMCVFAMYGVYEGPEVERGMKVLMEFLTNQRPRGGHHDYYAHLYAGQACFFAKKRNPDFWTKGYATIRGELIAAQDRNGCWSQDNYGGGFGTACATLVLQIPYRHLPIFQD